MVARYTYCYKSSGGKPEMNVFLVTGTTAVVRRWHWYQGTTTSNSCHGRVFINGHRRHSIKISLVQRLNYSYSFKPKTSQCSYQFYCYCSTRPGSKYSLARFLHKTQEPVWITRAILRGRTFFCVILLIIRVFFLFKKLFSAQASLFLVYISGVRTTPYKKRLTSRTEPHRQVAGTPLCAMWA